ncbi:MAG TPA: PilZ domain-containing protein [Pseudolabrys sp.]|nr:PilZ domain-containing protein [Pseudolabrys sp.]
MTLRSPNTRALAPESGPVAADPGTTDALKPLGAKPVLVGTHGRYTLRSWRDASGRPRQFACTVVKFSAERIRLAGPVTGAVGEWVNANFDHFGGVEGPITEASQGQFTMWIVASAESRQKIARKVAWANDKNSVNRRRHERHVPRDPDSILHFADGSIAACQIIDYSLSGVAATGEIVPKVGAIVKIGDIHGQVLRHTGDGFIVEFFLVQDAHTIERLFMNSQTGFAADAQTLTSSGPRPPGSVA